MSCLNILPNKCYIVVPLIGASLMGSTVPCLQTVHGNIDYSMEGAQINNYQILEVWAFCSKDINGFRLLLNLIASIYMVLLIIISVNCKKAIRTAKLISEFVKVNPAPSRRIPSFPHLLPNHTAIYLFVLILMPKQWWPALWCVKN